MNLALNGSHGKVGRVLAPALEAAGHRLVALDTADAMVDFTDGEAVVKYAMSTLHMSSRDWVDLWITPWSDNLELPLDGSLGLSTDLQGPPRTDVHVRMTGDRTP